MAEAKKNDLLLTDGKFFVWERLRKLNIAIKGEKIAALRDRLSVVSLVPYKGKTIRLTVQPMLTSF